MMRTRCIGLDDMQPDVGSIQNGAIQLAMADLLDETQPVKSKVMLSVRANIHWGGGADRVFPEWIQWGGG